MLAVGILGRSGLVFEEDCKRSIRCLDYFGKVDPHARQYSLILQSLLKTTTTHVRKREIQLRSQRKQASSQLFGLLPPSSEASLSEPPTSRAPPTLQSCVSSVPDQDSTSATASSDWTIYDADFFALPWLTENDQALQDFLQPGTHNMSGASVADIPLFPIYDQQGLL